MTTILLCLMIMYSQEDLNTLKHLKLEGVSTRETIANYQEKLKDLTDKAEKEKERLDNASKEKTRLEPIMFKSGCSQIAKNRCDHKQKGTVCLRLSYQSTLKTIDESMKSTIKLKADIAQLNKAISDKKVIYDAIVKKYQELIKKGEEK
jgi:prefoldin subunit 5